MHIMCISLLALAFIASSIMSCYDDILALLALLMNDSRSVDLNLGIIANSADILQSLICILLHVPLFSNWMSPKAVFMSCSAISISIMLLYDGVEMHKLFALALALVVLSMVQIMSFLLEY